MRAYIELTKADLLLALRDKSVLFFSYLFPLIFFFAFAELFYAGRGGTISHVVSMVLLMGILGNGLFGAGMRTVHDRENHILRRFKVAPISAAPILAASVVTGWILYAPAVVLVLGLASGIYGMEMPARPLAFLAMVTLGVTAFRALGLILASVANSMQEVNILVQIFYTPMLFLSGALFPITVLPQWVQLAAQYLPATYLVSGLQGIFLRGESLTENWVSAVALTFTLAIGLFLSVKLFRWEKEEKVPFRSKLWLLAVLAPFLLLGTIQIYSRDQIERAQELYRQLQRSETLLIQNARIFRPDGDSIENGALLIARGRIEAVYDVPPDSGAIEAEILDASGKTVLPGLIDLLVYPLGPERIRVEKSGEKDLRNQAFRTLASQLYCGITTVRASNLPLSLIGTLKESVERGRILGSEIFTLLDPDRLTPRSRAAGLSSADFLLVDPAEDPGKWLPPGISRPPLVRRIKDYSEPGNPNLLATAEELLLPIRLDRWSGSRLEQIPSEEAWLIATLGAVKAARAISRRDPSYLERPLVLQVQATELEELRQQLRELGRSRRSEFSEADLPRAYTALRRLQEIHPRLAAASRAGLPFLFQGPALHQELTLWEEAGIPRQTILETVTVRAAEVLGQSERIGAIRAGMAANLLIVDGNPLEEIATLERISTIIYKGERLDRSKLLVQEW